MTNPTNQVGVGDTVIVDLEFNDPIYEGIHVKTTREGVVMKIADGWAYVNRMGPTALDMVRVKVDSLEPRGRAEPGPLRFYLDVWRRENVIQDILSWQVVDGSANYDQMSLRKMAPFDVNDLKETWQGTVGEWLASHDDIKDVDLEWRLVQTGRQSYGY
jgi:hypothetical protein